MPIRVKAVFPYGGYGFDGRARRRDGDVFDIDEALFSENWMVRVDSATGEPAGGEGEPVASHHAVKLAEELGVDLSAVTGTGKDGSITKADVEAAASEDWE